MSSSSVVNQILTPDQLKQLDRKAERAASRVLRKYRRSAILAFLILLAGGAGERLLSADDARDQRTAIVKSGNAIAVASCNRDFRTAVGVQAILSNGAVRARQEFDRGRIDKQELEARLQLVADQLRAYPLPDCRTVRHSITQNPDRSTRIPHPFYPGDPQAPKPPQVGG